MKRKHTWIKTNSATHMLQNVFASSEHQFANSDSLRYCFIITLEGNEIINTDKSRKRLQVIWLLFSFNENAPSREDGEKLENIGDRLGKKRYFKALVQLGHLRVKDVFVGNISKNCTKIGYINQHHDILFSSFVFYFFCGLSLSFGFSTCCLRNFKVKQFSSSEAVIFYNIFLVFRFD